MRPSSQRAGGADAAATAGGATAARAPPVRQPRSRASRSRRTCSTIPGRAARDLGVGLVVRGVGAVPGVVHAEPAGGDGIRVEGAEEADLGAVGVVAGEAPRGGRRARGRRAARGRTRRTTSARSGGRRARPSRCRRARCGAGRRRCAGACRCRAPRRDVPEESTTTRSPSPASSKASRSRNSPMGERQMFPQHTTVTRYASGSAGERAESGSGRSLMGPILPGRVRDRVSRGRTSRARPRGTRPAPSGRPPPGCGPTAGRRSRPAGR